MTDPIEVRVQVHGIYDPWRGTWEDYPTTQPPKSDMPGSAMVLAITGVFCIVAFGLWMALL